MPDGKTDRPGGVRLQKILSVAGIASRRSAERLISDGRVTVNGQPARRLGTCADPSKDDIRVDGRRVGAARKRRYVIVHKPRGYVTTRIDPQRRRTVLDLVPKVRDYIYPVGRLDYDSEGLLLLTNDGELAARLTHPRHGVPRVYEATVLGVPTQIQLRRLARGVNIKGRRTLNTEVRLLSGERLRRGNYARVQIVLREGRNRQVRKMFEIIGHPVVRLRRTALGPLRLRGLKLGEARNLVSGELKALRRAVAVVPDGAVQVSNKTK